LIASLVDTCPAAMLKSVAGSVSMTVWASPDEPELTTSSSP
jgi:hypothetical protein